CFSVYSFSNAPAPTRLYTLSLHDALPIYERVLRAGRQMPAVRPEYGRDGVTVQLDQPGEGPGGPASAHTPRVPVAGRRRVTRANAFAKSVSKTSNGHVRIAGRATMT